MALGDPGFYEHFAEELARSMRIPKEFLGFREEQEPMNEHNIFLAIILEMPLGKEVEETGARLGSRILQTPRLRRYR